MLNLWILVPNLHINFPVPKGSGLKVKGNDVSKGTPPFIY